jgi:putative ABC transport system permease protein
MPDFREEIKKRLANVRFPPTRENEIVEELSQHLEDQYEQLLSRGESEEEAYADTVRGLDENELLGRELQRVERRAQSEPVALGKEKANLLGDFWQDLRYGLRMLVKNPGFTIVAVAALALGIGANTAIFSVVNSVLLQPLPFKDPNQLVMLWEDATHLGFPKNTPSPANFLDWQRQNSVFAGMAAMAPRSFNLTGSGEPERLDGRRVSANLFQLLGVQPQLGRAFRPEEDAPGSRVVILSNGLWQRRFGGDRQIIGRAINLSGESYTVIGVMPTAMELPRMTDWHDQLWVTPAFPAEEATSRGSHYLQVIARMKPGVTLPQAQAEMKTIAARLARQYPEDNLRIGATVNPLREEYVGEIRPALLILLGAVAFVLLIACANVANLLLARAAVRQKEISLRLALGATRSRLVRQFLTESLLLAAGGCAFGLLLAGLGLDLLKNFIPATIALSEGIAIDGKVLAFTAFVGMVTGVAFGLAPAAQASRFDLNENLKEGGRDGSAGYGTNRLRSLLVIGEVAISFLLLIGAGLLINSFIHLRNLDPGFNPDHLLTATVQLSETKYPTKEKRAAFFQEVVRRVRAFPGVQSVGVGNNLPFTYDGDSMPIGVEGRRDPPPDERLDVVLRVVGPGYFKTMQIPLVKGRDFTEDDRDDDARVVVISEKTAARYWPGQDPVGKRLRPGSLSSDSPWRTVIGVVKDVRQNDFIAAPKPQMYMSYHQVRDFPPNALVIRTQVAPLSLAGSVRDAIWSVDKDQPVSEIRTMSDIVSQAVARQRFSMLLLGLFAGLALLLAAVGIYGVMSYTVAQRTHEIGIRMALGAQRGDVLKLALGQGLRLVTFGVLIGLAAAFVLTRVMTSLLFGVSPTDSMTFITISVVLMSVAALASYIPALRATRVDPMLALRYQ